MPPLNDPSKDPQAIPFNSFSAICWTILFFILLTTIFNVFFDNWLKRQSPEKRNVHYRRGWAEHVISPSKKKKNEKLIIIVANSQGYGREVSDKQSYPSLLEDSLANQFSQNIRILNWSIYGGSVKEMTMLTAAAKRLQADIFLYIDRPSGFHVNYVKANRKRGWLSNFSFDVRFLLWHPDIRKTLPPDFLSYYFGPMDYVDISLAHLFKPWYYRELPVSFVLQNEDMRKFNPSKWSQKWVSAPRDTREKQERLLRQTEKMIKTRREQLKENAISWKAVKHLLDTTQGLTAEKYFISMPVHTLIQGESDLILPEISTRFSKKGFRVLDFSKKIPDYQYLSMAHLNETGHQTMAELLTEIIAK
ncbi:MAG: hypothetical protein GY702_27840 [Desulfobulbaceae bacterium]|nr:hypothetical protein [Desulfobulbaceae bacterium]